MDTEDIMERLFIWGCDTDEALSRLGDDEEMYLSFIDKYCKDEDIDKLESYVKERDIDSAHSQAHTLKGVYGNLAITPIYDILSDIVTTLRKGVVDGVSDKICEVREQKKELEDIVGNCEERDD